MPRALHLPHRLKQHIRRAPIHGTCRVPRIQDKTKARILSDPSLLLQNLALYPLPFTTFPLCVRGAPIASSVVASLYRTSGAVPTRDNPSMFQNRTLAVQRFISFHHALIRPFTATADTVHHKIPDSSDSPSLVQCGGSLSRPFAPSPLTTTIPSFSKCEPLPTVGGALFIRSVTLLCGSHTNPDYREHDGCTEAQYKQRHHATSYVCVDPRPLCSHQYTIQRPGASLSPTFCFRRREGQPATPHHSPGAYPFAFVYD